MNTGNLIVSVIAVLACLLLATRNARVRSLGAKRIAVLLLIWGGIIMAVVAVISVSGLHLS